MDNITDAQLNEAFEKLRSTIAGAKHAVGQFLKTGSGTVAKAGYTAQNVLTRKKLFNTIVGDALFNIQKYDTKNVTKLKQKPYVGKILVKSKDAVNEPVNGAKYTSDTGFEYTYDAKTKYWRNAHGDKMGNTPAMTQSFLKRYPKGYITESSVLNEAGEIDGYTKVIQNEVETYIKDLAAQFNVIGNSTNQILKNLQKIKNNTDLQNAVNELLLFLNDIKNVNIQFTVPVVKIQSKISPKKVKQPTQAEPPKQGEQPTSSATKSSDEGEIPKGSVVKTDNYTFEFDGKNWIDVANDKPVKPSQQKAFTAYYLAKHKPAKTDKPQPKTAPTVTPPSSGKSSVKLKKENKTNLRYKEFFV